MLVVVLLLVLRACARCDFDEVTPGGAHFNSSRPAIFRGVLRLEDRWSPQELLRRLGGEMVAVAHPHFYELAEGEVDDKVTLSAYVQTLKKGEKESSVIFDTHVLQRTRQFRMQPPQSLENVLSQPVRVLSVGGHSVGLPFHAHGCSWIALHHGRKQWMVYKPGAAPRALRGSLSFNHSLLMKAVRGSVDQPPFECTQEPGLAS